MLQETKKQTNKRLWNVDWIKMAQDKNKRWALVNNVMNLGFV